MQKCVIEQTNYIANQSKFFKTHLSCSKDVNLQYSYRFVDSLDKGVPQFYIILKFRILNTHTNTTCATVFNNQNDKAEFYYYTEKYAPV